MAQATQLNATEQDTLVKQIGLSLLRAAPRDWQRVTAEYRAVGRYHELAGEIVLQDGSAVEWVATHDIATLFGRLRAGMYREGRGTWFNARYQLDHPSSYNLEYDREEPKWDLMPPPQAYADELRMFPRTEDNVPEWLMRRMSGLGPERPGPRFRIARIFDGAGPSGRPVINRPELEVDEQDRILDYLDGAPVVVPSRGYDIDRLASTPEGTVPVAFHSDGVWIWPAAVNYYLREYGVSPEPDLVQHIHGCGFVIPDVPDSLRQAAAGHINRGAPPPPRPAPPVAGRQAEEPPADDTPTDPPPNKAPEDGGYGEPRFEDAEFAEAEAPPADPPTRLTDPVEQAEPLAPPEEDERAARPDLDATMLSPAVDPGPPTTAVSPVKHAAPEPPVGERTTVEQQVPDERRHEPDPDDGGPPTQVGHAPLPPVPEHAEPVLEDLQEKLHELGVEPDVYRIGEPIDHGWSIEEVPSGWRVGWYDGELTNPAVFGDPEDAAAFMLGKLLLVPDGSAPRTPAPPPVQERPPAPSPAPAPQPQAAPPPGPPKPPPPKPKSPVLATLSPEVATGMARPGPAREPVPDNPPPRQAPPPPAAATQIARPVQPREPAADRSGAGQGPQQQWPIQPMEGEPPLTLFRGKELRELPAGSELDRFGGPAGNLTYAAGTPFEERSLVPEWVNRPYHVYRVQRPLEALAGVAIPWFNQPGGGAAYLLPASIEELVADGDLIELEPGEPPID